MRQRGRNFFKKKTSTSVHLTFAGQWTRQMPLSRADTEFMPSVFLWELGSHTWTGLHQLIVNEFECKVLKFLVLSRLRLVIY